MLHLVTWSTLLACATPAPGVEIPLASPGWDEIVPGARVALVVSRGVGDARETSFAAAGCVEVLAVTEGGIRIDASARPELGGPGAAVRPALCTSSATALSRALLPDRYAVQVPTTVPAALRRMLRPADHVDVLVSLPATAGREATTLTMLHGVEVVGDTASGEHLGLSVSSADAEKIAHAGDAGTVHLTVLPAPREDPATSTRMASMVPPGLVIAGVPAPARGALAGFLAGGDYVDLVLVTPDGARLLHQAVFMMGWGEDHPGDAPAILGLATPQTAEQWMFASTFLGLGYLLRSPNDDVAVPDVATAPLPGPQPPPTAEPVSARIAQGARGVEVPFDRSVVPAPGTRSPLKGTGCPADALVLAVEPGRALVQLPVADAVAAMAPGWDCRIAAQ